MYVKVITPLGGLYLIYSHRSRGGGDCKFRYCPARGVISNVSQTIEWEGNVCKGFLTNNTELYNIVEWEGNVCKGFFWLIIQSYIIL